MSQGDKAGTGAQQGLGEGVGQPQARPSHPRRELGSDPPRVGSLPGDACRVATGEDSGSPNSSLPTRRGDSSAGSLLKPSHDGKFLSVSDQNVFCCDGRRMKTDQNGTSRKVFNLHLSISTGPQFIKDSLFLKYQRTFLCNNVEPSRTFSSPPMEDLLNVQGRLAPRHRAEKSGYHLEPCWVDASRPRNTGGQDHKAGGEIKKWGRWPSIEAGFQSSAGLGLGVWFALSSLIQHGAHRDLPLESLRAGDEQRAGHLDPSLQ